MKSSQRNADLRTLAYATLQGIAWQWNERNAFITFVRDENVQKKIIYWWCFKIHASFVLISCYKSIACKQVTQMANYQTSSEATTSSQAQMELAWPLSNKTEMRTAQEIADDLSVFWTTLTFFCVYIIDAKLSVKLLCCLKDKKQRRVCLSRADCYDQSSRRLTIK